ncbi:MAG: acyl carrier protein [Erysipelotrichales bacterium]|nr:acyl carrier protein [Erysipelotrichales bacterium]MBQ1386432.1 acyl carrier protein [Erysipelotrichales bacterium]MBQ2309852.1 acyl carrier protein [Erysipelotrichales bacterium]MBQ2478675.1 acyl carrier protein [Erysipelotrichales bacterium]MBQ5542505.1 acyl carrier protein [Erysipelotrichales bacterium]
MITREEVYNLVIKTIKDNVPDMFGDDLSESTVLNADGNVDSMGFILVLTKLEGALDVKVPDEEWNKLRTIGDIVDAFMKYLPKA